MGAHCRCRLAAQSEFADLSRIGCGILLLVISLQSPPFADKFEKAPPRAEILSLVLKVLSEVGYALSENGDLGRRRTGPAYLAEFIDQFFFAFSGYRHLRSPSLVIAQHPATRR